MQIQILRGMTVDQRAALAFGLTDQVVRLARAGIERAHPGKSEIERRLLFIEAHYGRELAERVRRHWARRVGAAA